MCNLCAVPFPQLQVQRRPERHEDREKNCCGIIDEMRDLGIRATITQLPKITTFITQGAHRHVQGADIAADGVAACRRPSVEDTEETDDGRRDQHVGVETKPREVESEFDAKVVLKVVDGLEFYAFRN